MNMAPPLTRHAAELDAFLALFMKLVLVAVVLGLDNDGPACWKDVLVQIQLDRFEEEAAEDRLDAQALSIGKMHNCRSRGHPYVTVALSQDARRSMCREGVGVVEVKSPMKKFE